MNTNNAQEMVPVTRAELKINFNNKGLKMLFPGTVITKKKLEMGDLDPSMLSKYIKSSELNTKYPDCQFTLEDIELEGEFNNWDLLVKLKVF
jgi:hypothetical protein